MTQFRPFSNSDSPALVALWNRAVPSQGAVRPLTLPEFDLHVLGRPHFDAAGLMVAERDGVVLGYSHSGFGPADADSHPFQVDSTLGTISMLVVDPAVRDNEIADGLVAAGVSYLKAGGAQVLYAGEQWPLNPFYWGIYGGSESSGILDRHLAFHLAVSRAGFEPIASTILMEADLTKPARSRDPRSVMIKRLSGLDVQDDALPSNWWEALAIGDFHPTQYRLVSRDDATLLTRASTWDMTWFGREDGLGRLGLTHVEVHAEHRRKGYGRHLVSEILRMARAHAVAIVSVQTQSSNLPALSLYQSLGFEPVESSTQYRLPGGSSPKERHFLP